MKPMLAVDHDPAKLQFPVLASPKLDGIRGLIWENRLLSRSLKPIPNKYISATLSNPLLEGFDGELIVGEPTATDCYNASVSAIMRHDGEPAFTFWVFDLHDTDACHYQRRLDELSERVRQVAKDVPADLRLLPQVEIADHDQLLDYEATQLALGYEGLILRHPKAPYKYGRSTVREGYLLKVKRFVDSEAVITGFEEQMFNGNEATTNELGRTKRSSHKAGMVGKNTLGALIVKDVTSGLQFNVGTGLNDEIRQKIWRAQDSYLGQLVKYKYFPVGVKELPRHPVFLGFRHQEDM